MSWYEMDGWPKDLETSDDFCPERKLIGPWADRWNQIAMLEDLEYPYYPGCRTYPATIACEPFSAQKGAPSEKPDYDTAVITVKYTSKNTGGNVVAMEWLEPTVYHDPTTMAAKFWTTRGERIPHPFESLEHSGLVFHHWRKKVGIVPINVISAVDKVNASALYAPILDVTFAAQTLKVNAPKIERTWKVGGLTNYSVHQTFSYKNNGGLGWNAILNPEAGVYQYAVNVSNIQVTPYLTTAIYLC
jgi:hypothetical protein